MRKEDYPEIYRRLMQETAILKFIKADGTNRIMLATRNTVTSELMGDNLIGLLGGYDKRCNRHNGNIAVIDLALVTCRSFNIERLVDVKWCGVVETEESLSEAIESYREYVKSFDIDETSDNEEPIKF